jgi:hypothetical protein
MSIVAYLAERVPWAVVGLLAGYLLGRGIRILERIDAADSPEESKVDKRSRGARRVTGTQVLGVVVFLLAVGTMTQGYIQNQRSESQATCLRNYSNGFADALEVRSKTSAEAQQALDDLMTEIGQLTSSPSADNQVRFRVALQTYLSKRAETKQEQKDNPYPAPPRDVCK